MSENSDSRPMTDDEAMEAILNAKIKFWTCPVCKSPPIKWNGNKAWCEICGRSNDDTVCQCGEPSLVNVKGLHIGCCEKCLPF